MAHETHKIKFILTDGTKTSKHSSWRAVAQSYKWDERNSMNAMRKHGRYLGYKLQPIEMGVTIPCQYLREWLETKAQQVNDYKEGVEGTQEVNFDIGFKEQFTVVAEIRTTTELVECSTDAVGFDNYVDDGDITIESIIRVFDPEGDILNVDEKTEQIIIKYLEI